MGEMERELRTMIRDYKSEQKAQAHAGAELCGKIGWLAGFAREGLDPNELLRETRVWLLDEWPSILLDARSVLERIDPDMGGGEP